jgi:hypothetical protein
MRILALLFAITFNLSFAFAQERQWSLDASEKEAFLVFGVADTDDVGLSFWCKIGSGKISIFATFDRDLIKKDQKADVQLLVDAEKFDIKMQASIGSGSRTGSLEGPVSVDGTVMKAVEGSQSFRLTAFGHSATYPLIDADVNGLRHTCSGDVLN